MAGVIDMGGMSIMLMSSLLPHFHLFVVMMVVLMTALVHLMVAMVTLVMVIMCLMRIVVLHRKTSVQSL